MEKMRLDKFLTSQNICSRKEAGILARKGEITVNGVICKNADIKIDAETAEVAVKGKSVFYNSLCFAEAGESEVCTPDTQSICCNLNEFCSITH